MRHRGIVTGILAVLGVGMLLAAVDVPVSAADRPYAVVNLSKIFNDYEKTKLYDKKLQEAQEKYQKERETKVQALKEAQNRMALLKEEEQKKAREDTISFSTIGSSCTGIHLWMSRTGFSIS